MNNLPIALEILKISLQSEKFEDLTLTRKVEIILDLFEKICIKIDEIERTSNSNKLVNTPPNPMFRSGNLVGMSESLTAGDTLGNSGAMSETFVGTDTLDNSAISSDSFTIKCKKFAQLYLLIAKEEFFAPNQQGILETLAYLAYKDCCPKGGS